MKRYFGELFTVILFMSLSACWFIGDGKSASPPAGTTMGPRDRGYLNYSTRHKDHWGQGGGAGDMTKTVYDPTNRNTDAFNRMNHYGNISAARVVPTTARRFVTDSQIQAWDNAAIGGVQSFKGRTGNVVPVFGDYSITKISGAGIAAQKGVTGTGTKVVTAAALSTPIAGCGQFDANGNLASTGSVCGSGGGSGTVSSGTTGQFAFYAANGTIVSGKTLNETDISTAGGNTNTLFKNYTTTSRLTTAHYGRDDHTQYFNTARGDARYPLKSVYDAYTSQARPTAAEVAGSTQFSIVSIGVAPTDHSNVNGRLQTTQLNNTRNIDVYQYIANSSGITLGGTFYPFLFTTQYVGTDLTAPTLVSSGLHSVANFGTGGTASKGTIHAGSFSTVVGGNGDNSNEHASLFGALRYDIGTGYTQSAGTSGRAWLGDFSLHGPIGVRPNILTGFNIFTNNYYNGSPLGGPSGALWLQTNFARGGGNDATHGAADTFPMDVALGITGNSYHSSTTDNGWNTAIQIGGWGGGWQASGDASRIGTGIKFQDTFTADGIDLSGATITGSAIKLAPTQTFTDGTVTKTLAELAVSGTADLGGASSENVLYKTGAGAIGGFGNYSGGRLGIGTTNPSTSLHVVDTGIPVIGERTGSITNDIRTALAAVHSTSGTIGDGFGPVINMGIQGANVARTYLGAIGVRRVGNDTSGAVIINTMNSGSTTAKLRVNPNGNIIIGPNVIGTDPTSMLQVDGSIAGKPYISSNANDYTLGDVLIVTRLAAGNNIFTPQASTVPGRVYFVANGSAQTTFDPYDTETCKMSGASATSVCYLLADTNYIIWNDGSNWYLK